MLNGIKKSMKYKRLEILTSREKRTQNAANPTGYSAMETPRSIIDRRSPKKCARVSRSATQKTQKWNLISEECGE